jgi:hypothetical protein
VTDDHNQAMEIAYLALGRLIAGQCPPGFKQAVLAMEIVGDETRLEIVSTQADGTEVQMPPSADAAADILESLRGIRREMEGADGRPWRICTVTLIAGGGFQLEVGY